MNDNPTFRHTQMTLRFRDLTKPEKVESTTTGKPKRHRDNRQQPCIVLQEGDRYRFKFGAEAGAAIKNSGITDPHATVIFSMELDAYFVIVDGGDRCNLKIHDSTGVGTGYSFDNKESLTQVVAGLGLTPDEHGRYHFRISDNLSNNPEWLAFGISRP